MAITINYTNISDTFSGLKDYFDYYETTFDLTSHYATGGYSGVDSSDNIVGSTNYGSTYSDLQYASETEAASQSSAFIAEAVADEQLGYTLFNSPTHTLFGEINQLSFGENLSSVSDLWELDSTYFTLEDFSDINDGINHSTNTVIAGDTTGASGNDTHDLIWDLMQGNTTVLDGFLDANGTNQIGTDDNDTFDAFDGVDTFVVDNGADGDDADVINAGFQTGSGGDIIKITGTNDFSGSEAAAVASVVYIDNGTNYDATLTYNSSGSNNDSIEILGIANNSLTAANFDIA